MQSTARPEDGLRLLLIEDNRGDARFVQELLRDGPVRSIRWVETLGAAFDALCYEEFDIVLMDLSLPDSTGICGVQRIRDAAYRVPLVVLSGAEDESTAVEAVKEGAQDYLVKGRVDEQALHRALQYARHRFTQMHGMAFYDVLTGLENRALFLQNLNLTIEQCKRYNRSAAVLFIDLDGFKAINDRFGHEQGDIVLRAVADRLRGCVRKGDVVARLGGDEFVVLLPSLTQPADADRVAAKVVRGLLGEIPLPSGSAQIGASVGVSIYPESGTDAASMLSRADAAMYDAKRSGKNRFMVYGALGGPLYVDSD